eukprot:7362390-Pyramimonas_sp.AAC.1
MAQSSLSEGRWHEVIATESPSARTVTPTPVTHGPRRLPTERAHWAIMQANTAQPLIPPEPIGGQAPN